MFVDSQLALHELVLPANGTGIDLLVMGAPRLTRFGGLSAPNLSPDGLRLVFSATVMVSQSSVTGVMYASRDSVTTPFTYGEMVFLQGPPAEAETPFLTEDCSRVYFSGLESVFYVTEQL